MRWTVVSSGCALVAACGSAAPAPSPAPAPAPDVPAPIPAPVAPTLSFVYRPAHLTVRMTSEAMTAVSEGASVDSQRVRSDLVVSMDITSSSDALRVHGRLDSLVVEPARLAGAGTGFTRLNLPVSFTGALSARGHFALRVGADSVGGCWSEARAALDQIGSLFPAVPASLRPGERWQDSVETTTCRLGIRLRVREVRSFLLDGISDGIVAHVSYTARINAAGARTERTGTVTYAGVGNARGTLQLDVAAGVPRTDEREGSYRVALTVDGRTRELAQRTRWKAEVSAVP